MRLTITHAILFGLLCSTPLITGYPHEKNSDQRGRYVITRESIRNGTLGDELIDDDKRRTLFPKIISRGIPKLGDKPKDRDPFPPSGSRTGNQEDDVGDAPGAGGHAAFADGNLEKARVKGERLIDDLNDAIFRDLPSPERKDLEKLGYTIWVAKIGKPPFSTKSDGDYLKALNIQHTTEPWHTRAIYHESNQPVVETLANTKEGTLVITQSWKMNDKSNPPATWTDMVHDNWMEASASAKTSPKDLKFVARDTIQDFDTIDSRGVQLNTPDAIDAVFDKLKADETKMLTISAKSDNADIKASYQLLAAQTHVARVLQWLKDRRQDLDNLRIEKLHLTGSEHPSSSWNIVIELGRG